jgi:hypothetical protein
MPDLLAFILPPERSKVAATSERSANCWAMCVNTTLIYSHVLNRGCKSVKNPWIMRGEANEGV